MLGVAPTSAVRPNVCRRLKHSLGALSAAGVDRINALIGEPTILRTARRKLQDFTKNGSAEDRVRIVREVDAECVSIIKDLEAILNRSHIAKGRRRRSRKKWPRLIQTTPQHWPVHIVTRAKR